MNFIGAFELPAGFVTPMEIEEQRRQAEEQEEKARLKKKREKERYTVKNELAKQKAKEFTARKRAGLLTSEELEAEAQRSAKRAEYNKTYREKQAANLPPKPPSPQEVLRGIIACKKEGLPLTPEESEIYAAYREKENEKFRIYRAKIKANTPPKPPKLKTPTKKERMKDIGERLRAGLAVTAGESEAYALYRRERNAAHAEWRDSQATGDPEGLVIADIQKRMRDNLPITPEQTAFYEDWRIARNKERREYYYRKKAEMAEAVGQ